MEFVSPEGLRLDGRRPLEVRRLHSEMGCVPHADGSALFEMGNTIVLATVFGPHEVTQRLQTLHDKAIVKCEYTMASFSTGERRKRRQSDRRSTEIAYMVKQSLESLILRDLLPRTQIDVFLQVLQADGGAKCAAINAASLALVDAGIPIKDIQSSCAAGFLDGVALLDLNYVEDTGGGPDLSVALNVNLDEISVLQMDARLHMENFEQILSLAVKGCKTVGEHLKRAIHNRTLMLANSMNLKTSSSS